MDIPKDYLKKLQSTATPKALRITSERQDIIQRFVDKINLERVGTPFKPVMWRQINGLTAHVKVGDLYWLFKECDQGDSFSKKFFGILKSKRTTPPPFYPKKKKRPSHGRERRNSI